MPGCCIASARRSPCGQEDRHIAAAATAPWRLTEACFQGQLLVLHAALAPGTLVIPSR